MVKEVELVPVWFRDNWLVTSQVNIVPWKCSDIGSLKIKRNSLSFNCSVENETLSVLVSHRIETTVRLLKQITLAVDPMIYVLIFPARPIAIIMCKSMLV